MQAIKNCSAMRNVVIVNEVNPDKFFIVTSQVDCY